MTGKKLFIGNLPADTDKRDLKEIFEKYGKLEDVDVKNKDGQCFGFVEYQDKRDSEDAMKGRDGYRFDGHRIRVEYSYDNDGRRRDSDRGGRDRDRDRSFNRSRDFNRGGDRDRGDFNRKPFVRRPVGRPERSKYKLRIEGLPDTGSWQDIKDHMRSAGHICFTESFKNGKGLVEFVHRGDMEYALKNMDNTKFRSHKGDSSYIRLYHESDASASRSRSRGRGKKSRSRSYSPSISHDSRDVSRDRHRNKSNTKSKSRSKSDSVSPRKSDKLSRASLSE